MEPLRYTWNDAQGEHNLEFVHVAGTNGRPFGFGEAPQQRMVQLDEFFISTTTITQALWKHVMTNNPSLHREGNLPVENASWNDITMRGGFIQRLNNSDCGISLKNMLTDSFVFRLPSETEWEYAARGGPHWTDGFRYSGGNDIDAVAWYFRKHGDHTQPVAQKAPNQLGVYDMSGNVWEWCQDTFTPDLNSIPLDGSAMVARQPEERVLRGGCFHNWAQHCTVSKRYEIGRSFHDGCIGIRIVLGKNGLQGFE